MTNPHIHTITPSQPSIPAITVLALAYKLLRADDIAAQRAADRAVEHLQDGTPYDFSGTELRILSHRAPEHGLWYSTDGVSCTCESASYPICRHRALYALLLAEQALLSPLLLRVQIIDQITPETTVAPFGELPFVADPTMGWPVDVTDLFPR